MGLRQELPAFQTLVSSEGTDTTTSSCPITQAFVTQICRSRMLFLTDSGTLGIGPQRLRTGDSVCYLAGAAIPLLLRARSNPDVTHRRWLLVGETYVDGLTEPPRLEPDRDYDSWGSRKVIYSNESIRCNEDDKDARVLLHTPHLQRLENFLHAIEAQDLRNWLARHSFRSDVWSPFNNWCERVYRFERPGVDDERSALARVNLARRFQFCID